jgi:hypothetical protein
MSPAFWQAASLFFLTIENGDLGPIHEMGKNE